MIKRAHFDHSKFVNDLQKQCKEVLGPRDMLCTIKRTTTSKKKFIYIVISKFRLLLFKPSKHLLRTYTPHLLHNIHLFDITQISSQRKDELEIEAKGIDKIHLFKDDKDESLDDLIALIVSLDEQLFPTKDRRDLIQIDVPMSRLPYIPEPDEEDPCGGFSLTFQAYCDYLGLPLSNLDIEFHFVVDKVYGSKNVYEFNINDFVSHKHWSTANIAALLGALTFNSYFTSLNLSECEHFDESLVSHHLAQLIQHNEGFEIMNFDKVEFSRDTLLEFSNALIDRKTSPLKTLSLRNIKEFDDKVALRLSSAINSLENLEKLMLDGSNMGEEGSKAISAALLVWQRAHTSSSSSSSAAASPAPVKGSDDSHVSTRPRLASLQRQPRSKRLQAAGNGDVRRRSNSSGSRTSPVVDKRTGLPSHVVAAVADAGDHTLKKLDLSTLSNDEDNDNNNQDDTDAVNHTPTFHLSLADAPLGTRATSALVAYVAAASLASLNLSNTQVCVKQLIESLLIGSPALIELNISKNTLNENESGLLTAFVKTRTSLQKLDISQTNVKFETFYSVLSKMAPKSTLIAKNMGYGKNDLERSDGSRRGVVSAPRTCQIECLDLSGNHFGEAVESIYALGHFIGGIKTLKELILQDLTPSSAKRLQSVQSMLVSHASARNLLAGVSGPISPRSPRDRPSSPRVTRQNTDKKAVLTPEAALARLARGLRHVARVDFSCRRGRPLRATLVPFLATLLANNKVITKFDVSGQQIGDDGLRALTQALLQHSSLDTLAFDGSRVSLHLLKYVARTLPFTSVRIVSPLPRDAQRLLSSVKNITEITAICDTLAKIQAEMGALAVHAENDLKIKKRPSRRAPRQFGAPLSVLMPGTRRKGGRTLRQSDTDDINNGKATLNLSRFLKKNNTINDERVTYAAPAWLLSLMEVVRRNLSTEGLFRVAAGAKSVAALRQLIDEGNFNEHNLDDIDVHLACTTIKLFLRNLPKPLIPNDVNDALFEATKSSGAPQLQKLRSALALLPGANLEITKRLMALLSAVVCDRGNKMNAENLAIVFAPTIVAPGEKGDEVAALTHARQALELLLERWPELFLRRATNPALTMVSLTVSPPEDDDNDRVTPPIEDKINNDNSGGSAVRKASLITAAPLAAIKLVVQPARSSRRPTDTNEPDNAVDEAPPPRVTNQYGKAPALSRVNLLRRDPSESDSLSVVELSTDFDDDDDDSEYPEPPSDDEDAPPNNDGTLRFAEVSDESYVDSEESDDDSDLYAVDSRGNTKVYTPSVVKMYRAETQQGFAPPAPPSLQSSSSSVSAPPLQRPVARVEARHVPRHPTYSTSSSDVVVILDDDSNSDDNQ